MAFREHPGFTITSDPRIRVPKGKIRRKKPKADMGFVRGDSITTTEQAIWLNPRYREQTGKELRDYLRG